ncbi:tyrosine-type recombinase/integrase [Stappia sp.]|uniref:tyrosine-type recombinase/integrase n=1 Tax=Stappia sp. TaxID=1870903 RepID=UPI003D1432BB
MTLNRYRYFYACAFSMFEEHLVAFVDEMVEHDHAESTVKIYLSCINDVAKAMGAAGIAARDLDETRAVELVAAMGWIKSRETYARFMMKRFVRFLAERGVLRERPTLSPREAARLKLRAAYEDYLRRQRGLSERTIIDSWRFAEQFLDFRFPDAADDLGNISAGDIARFLQARVIRRAPRDKTVPSHLRNFFRYLFKAGKTSTNLANAVPRVAQRFGTRLPRHLSLEQVDLILDAVRNTAPCSLRNYAMVLLMARLGLRPPEVVAMHIDDIDWRSGEILVRGKGDRHDRLPLLPEVGKALADYIKLERVTTSRSLFVISRPPHRPFKNAQVLNDILGKAYDKTGLKPPAPYVGAQILRHSLATNLVQNGASLEEISDTLRHRSRTTTMLYARLDVEGLRSIAQSWPTAGGVA